MIQHRVPTLPTPTTLRAMSTTVNCRSRCCRSDGRVWPYCSTMSRICSSSVLRSLSGSSSVSGVTRGGVDLNRRSPATTSVSFPAACRLSRPRALASVSASCLRPRERSSVAPSVWSCSASTLAYQTSRWRMAA